MRLADWRKQAGMTQIALAEALGVSQPYVSTMERARAPAIPGRALMLDIYRLSQGHVAPNDFYDLSAVSLACRAAA